MNEYPNKLKKNEQTRCLIINMAAEAASLPSCPVVVTVQDNQKLLTFSILGSLSHADK